LISANIGSTDIIATTVFSFSLLNSLGGHCLSQLGSTLPRPVGLAYYECRSINKLQNSVILLVF